MLRAIRFANRYDFTIEPDTWKALKMNAFLIEHVSKERIREELTKTFSGPKAGGALKRMDESGMLRIILPEVADMKGVPQPEKFHPEGDVFEHTVLAMNMLKHPTSTLAFGVLFHDIGKPKTYERTDRIRFNLHNKVGKEIANNVCKRLGFSNKNRKHIMSLVDRHMAFLNIREMRPSTLKRFLSASTIEEDIELHRIDCLSSHGDASNCDFCREKLEGFRQEHEEIIPPPLLTGHDLIDMGYTPGPQFKEILDAVEEAQWKVK